MSEEGFQELTDDDYKNMSRTGLYKRAKDLAKMITQQAGDNDCQMIVYMGVRNEAQRYISNKKGIEPTPTKLERLVKTIYKNLITQKGINLDLDWVNEVVFGKTTETGVGLMYSRLERVNTLANKFSEKK